MTEIETLYENLYGHWGEHPDHPVADWQHQVANSDTRLGYWQWVENRIENRIGTDLPDLDINSRDAGIRFMSFVSALEIVHSLASGNVIDANDIAFGDDALAGQRKWQIDALDSLHNLIVNHNEAIDRLPASTQDVEWPNEVWRAERNMDPTFPANAIRICLDSAEQTALEPHDAENIDLAEQPDRQRQAFDVTRDLLGMYGINLEKLVNTDIPGV